MPWRLRGSWLTIRGHAAAWVMFTRPPFRSAEEHAQWRNPDSRARWNATHPFLLGGVYEALSAWIPEGCNRAWGQGLRGEKSRQSKTRPSKQIEGFPATQFCRRHSLGARSEDGRRRKGCGSSLEGSLDAKRDGPWVLESSILSFSGNFPRRSGKMEHLGP